MTDQEITQAFRKANYFVKNERLAIAESILRSVSGLRIGHEIRWVLAYLELMKVGSPSLTNKGKDFLYEYFIIMLNEHRY